MWLDIFPCFLQLWKAFLVCSFFYKFDSMGDCHGVTTFLSSKIQVRVFCPHYLKSLLQYSSIPINSWQILWTYDLFLIVRQRLIGGYYWLSLGFYNSKILNCIGALSFIKICSRIFKIFKSNWSSDFGHAQTGSGSWTSGFSTWNFFTLVLK